MAREVDGSVRSGWRSLRFEGRESATVSEIQLYVDRNGVVKIERNSNQSFKLMSELRKLMYRPGYGTWFSLTMKIDDQGHAETHYNYDEEAAWSFPLDDESYVEDQQKFPRDPEHIPAWLAPKLGLGSASNSPVQ
nr:immunity protein YezG family protein [Arthrobacter sp. zg-Y769]